MKKNIGNKKVNLSSLIIASGISAAIFFVVGLNFTTWFSNYAPYLGLKSSSDMDWSSLDGIYNKLSTIYDGEIDKHTLIEGAKKGLTDSLGDIYTVYMDKEEAADFNDSLHGNVGSGIGIEMGLRDGYVRILRTLPDNPARKAGLLAGDIIYKVNGEEVYTESSEEISGKIRGESGTEVTVSVVRDGEELTYTMIRETINNVSAYINYEGSTAIITVTRFDSDTGTTVQNFAKEFKDKNISKVILDLRDNGGGYVSAAKDMLSLWIDGDVYYEQRSIRTGNKSDKTYSNRATLKGMNTIVLVNGSTASASEIVAGALQDYGFATILGEKTYGKGVVQELFNINGGAMLKVTTAHWYTPKGRTINKEGITPDVEVVRTYDDINTMKDPQLERALEL